MNPSKVDRRDIRRLTDLPNVGEATAEDLRRIGIVEPRQLKGRSPFDLYQQLCEETSTRQDPCVIDVFMSITRFMEGDEARPWWTFTEERKRLMKASAGRGSKSSTVGEADRSRS